MQLPIAVIFAGARVEDLSVLTERRAKAGVLVGGAYRTIDFALTNLANLGVARVGILAQYRPSSLADHVGTGLPWNLVGVDRGVRILSPYVGHERGEWYRGPADALYQNLDFIHASSTDDVLIVSGDHVYRMDYRPLLNFHREKDADFTMVFKPIEQGTSRFGIGELDAEGRIVNFTEKPRIPRTHLASIGIYLFKREVLTQELEREVSGSGMGNAGTFAIHEVIRRMIPRRHAFGFIFHGEWYYTRTLDEYVAFHQRLLGSQPEVDLQSWKIQTNTMTNRSVPPPPAWYGSGARVSNSLICNGCRIEGTVTNSILSPGVVVEKKAVVSDSILWDDVVVKNNAILEQVVSDKRTVFHENVIVGRDKPRPSEAMPASLSCGATVFGMNCSIPAGIHIGKNCIIHPGVSNQMLQHAVASGATVSPETA